MQALTTEKDRATELRPSIILVEDNEVLRQSIAEYMRLRGADVTEAASGTEFHELLLKDHYDIAILDVNLPDTSGFELAAQLSARDDMGIIMLTARARRDDRIHGYQQGADLYFTKPVDSAELAAAITNLTRRARKSDTLRTALPAAEAPPAAQHLVLDRRRHMLQAPEGAYVRLSVRETLFLEYLAQRPGTTVSRNDIAAIFGKTELSAESRVIDAALTRLRTRFRAAELELPIQVIYNAGLRLTRPIELV
ncbi:response regulator transcription factor [Xanthobacter sediminis]|uniref:response regulator transcription factor n=1 Tax=Xanthobacter sediminis TaxID=3119926 RepID=UPI00372C1083